MIRRLLVLVVWVSVLGVLAISPFLVWKFTPARDVSVLIVDKTVPFTDCREHNSLIWGLNHLKVPAPSGAEEWVAGRDYVGFFPVEPTENKESEPTWTLLRDADLTWTDLLYVADTYGVYEDDLRPNARQRAHLARNECVFGGFRAGEMDVVERFAANGGAVIAEFNTFAQPTSLEVRERWEHLLDVKWTGWAGRTIEDLSNWRDMPHWLPLQWELQYERRWDLVGPGIAFVHASERVLVLRMGTDIDAPGVTIDLASSDDPVTEDVADGVPYPYWFAIVQPQGGSRVHASFRVHATEQGLEALSAAGVPAQFPAVLSTGQDVHRFYLAGDFADSAIALGPYQVAGYAGYHRQIEAVREDRAGERFYWSFYLPLLDNLLRLVEER